MTQGSLSKSKFTHRKGEGTIWHVLNCFPQGCLIFPFAINGILSILLLLKVMFYV